MNKEKNKNKLDNKEILNTWEFENPFKRTNHYIKNYFKGTQKDIVKKKIKD